MRNWPPRLRRAAWLAALLTALACLTLAVTTGPVARLDRALFLFVQHHLWVAWLDGVMAQLTMLGDAVVCLLLLLWAAVVVRRPLLTEPIVALLAVAGAVGWLKHLVARLRPSQVIPNLHLIGPHLGNLSFPSGHTTTAVALAAILGRHHPHLRPLLWTLAAGVGLSRIYNGVHYPLDVLAGALLGTAIALAVDQLAPTLTGLTDRLHLHHTEPRGHGLHTALLALMGLLLVWQAFKTKQVPDPWRWPLFIIGTITCLTACLRTRPTLNRYKWYRRTVRQGP